ncbi:MAG: response regulator [Gammaproteobacteria bacterium]|nr:response regulator [Gammaproteobacteria bacterium]
MIKQLVTVLLVDEHNLIRKGIKKIIDETKKIKVIGEASSGEEALQLLQKIAPDVVVLDLRMPGIGGLETTRKILHFKPQIKVLILTVCDDNLYPARALQVGALGYVTKDAKEEELVQGILDVANGRKYIIPRLAQKMILSQASLDNKSPFEALSNRELQVVTMVTQGIKAPIIAKKLNLSPKTINTYRYRIFKKLHIKTSSDVELAYLAMQYGIVKDK